MEWGGGLLDEIGIWNRELSESEVTKLYNKGKGLNPLAPKASLEDASKLTTVEPTVQ